MKRVLIVEDEALLREAYTLILKSEGYNVECAENGKAALEKLRSFKPDLILLDMLMPLMSGEKFLQAARIPESYPDTKVVIVSNVSHPTSDLDAHKYGVAESLIKANLSPLELAQIAKKHCPL